MFPVLLVLCPLDGAAHSEKEVQELFADDVARLGNGRYARSAVMTAGPLGTGGYHQYFFNPFNPLGLALLVEYAQDCHHGFAVQAMRRPLKSLNVATPLSLSETGTWLDTMPPPSVRQIGPEDAELQDGSVADWIEASAHTDQLELENRMLRARLNM
jgi:hypothetical protein